jgi:DMSO/TMAO reductase YedYZ molybdopterin-dependent catalytic subunit
VPPATASGRCHASPTGQYLVDDFPVLSAGATPRTAHRTTNGASASGAPVSQPVSWPWQEFVALPSETFTVDIHCVTKWSKLDTTWTGVPLDALLERVETSAAFALAFCDGGYPTNLPLEDHTGGRAWIAYECNGAPLEPVHRVPLGCWFPTFTSGGARVGARDRVARLRPTRLLGGLRLPHYGDPGREQQYWND